MNFLNYFRERPVLVRNFAISIGVAIAVLAITKRLDKLNVGLAIAASGIVSWFTYKNWHAKATAAGMARMQNHATQLQTNVARLKARVK